MNKDTKDENYICGVPLLYALRARVERETVKLRKAIAFMGDTNDRVRDVLHGEVLPGRTVGEKATIDCIGGDIYGIRHDVRFTVPAAEDQREKAMGAEISDNERIDEEKHSCRACGLRAEPISHKGKYGYY